ncbi:vegetative cell wall protein gp1-like [Sipha flava]|uniref:Vegetative cell wall protein gp1-like n=1 Tax=Sipha flava TaxID=143950 RepID=A0A2S2QRT8_9HEMI|nr:vegetative cell wall protein gp1-like [Sipha flava]
MNTKILAILTVTFFFTEAKANFYSGFKNPSSCCGSEPPYGQLPLSYNTASCAQYPSFPPTALFPSPSLLKPCAPTSPGSCQIPDAPRPTSFQNLAYFPSSQSPYPVPCAPPPLSYPAPCSPLSISYLSPFTPQFSYFSSSSDTASFNPSLLASFKNTKSSKPSKPSSHAIASSYNTPPTRLNSCKLRPYRSPKFIPVQLKSLPNLKAPSCGAVSSSSPCQPGFGLNPSVFAKPICNYN